MLEDQQPHLGRLDSWESWRQWRDAVVGTTVNSGAIQPARPPQGPGIVTRSMKRAQVSDPGLSAAGRRDTAGAVGRPDAWHSLGSGRSR
ncbi:hypothetical protein GCM10017771_59120 [Streptomyces capitiformicae]|uniref:Uncharacterized protein n=1 Tax=Streptomyces capitiformicae TaxID=2014920 RepID=A0A918Z8A4_9ACTN|nr:hypothetical protein GCM10017771_59120 [Streptomyces capitiformicae]